MRTTNVFRLWFQSASPLSYPHRAGISADNLAFQGRCLITNGILHHRPLFAIVKDQEPQRLNRCLWCHRSLLSLLKLRKILKEVPVYLVVTVFSGVHLQLARSLGFSLPLLITIHPSLTMSDVYHPLLFHNKTLLQRMVVNIIHAPPLVPLCLVFPTGFKI